ncbi:hypothetical protein GSI_14987 [Ganoderma sinense ZZ0214-1]|uniref:Uncharacterized protein n=1 Tax=Ganoderma sinense ZZ0214-1 TaxID=1077348 RepID=A0A2G8RL64_9APHY|nr:hypothetical protein GSI_14987 [Ganoderma sinense ZZ0214-1]
MKLFYKYNLIEDDIMVDDITDFSAATNSKREEGPSMGFRTVLSDFYNSDEEMPQDPPVLEFETDYETPYGNGTKAELMAMEIESRPEVHPPNGGEEPGSEGTVGSPSDSALLTAPEIEQSESDIKDTRSGV